MGKNILVAVYDSIKSKISMRKYTKRAPSIDMLVDGALVRTWLDIIYQVC